MCDIAPFQMECEYDDIQHDLICCGVHHLYQALSNICKSIPIVRECVTEYHCTDFEPKVKEEEYEKCSRCQYFLTSCSAYPCNHCIQGRSNHFTPILKAGEQER